MVDNPMPKRWIHALIVTIERDRSIRPVYIWCNTEEPYIEIGNVCKSGITAYNVTRLRVREIILRYGAFQGLVIDRLR